VKTHMILGSLVLTHYQRVTDRQTDTPPTVKLRSSIAEAEREKNGDDVNRFGRGLQYLQQSTMRLSCKYLNR